VIVRELGQLATDWGHIIGTGVTHLGELPDPISAKPVVDDGPISTRIKVQFSDTAFCTVLQAGDGEIEDFPVQNLHTEILQFLGHDEVVVRMDQPIGYPEFDDPFYTLVVPQPVQDSEDFIMATREVRVFLEHLSLLSHQIQRREVDIPERVLVLEKVSAPTSRD